MIGIQYFIDALSLGSLYALTALGVALTFGVMRLVNFAQGEFLSTSAYALIVPSTSATATLLIGGWPWYVAAPVTCAIAGTIAVMTERVAFRPLRGAAPATLLMTSFAVSYLLQQMLRLIYGSQPKSIGLPWAIDRSWTAFGVRLAYVDLIMIVTTWTLLAILVAFLTRTRVGLQLRAASEDFVAAQLLGVAADRVIAIAFFVSGVLSGVAALLLVAKTGSAQPTMGASLVLFAFVAVIIGGMGSLPGAVAGAYLVGGLTVLLQVLLPPSVAGLRDAVLFACVILVLIVRPQGLFQSAGGGDRA